MRVVHYTSHLINSRSTRKKRHVGVTLINYDLKQRTTFRSQEFY
jgi:hypothetical protein